MIKNADEAAEHDLELLSFRVQDQEYCVDIMSVREIRGWTVATPLPFAPPHIKGVINLRGTVLPVVDLSARLGMRAIEPADRNVIIVVSLDGNPAGLLVDAVSDILTVSPAEMQTPPEIGPSEGTAFIRSLLLVGDKLIRLLDLDHIVTRETRDVA
ncbi:chemotaxis protein CheW [Paracoccus sp. SCSIO 75233]|uniref:chemotaxis protein CheW n=1 Tax=Paracoccus sp. SCSIO 75233 TaxID=3017782 RepID=UPI0022F0F4FA|nr:chemotaxis protein CheW [Paracoccus sp. SCSIO 75233]WBU54556.1 chemotaxis protein CheW [Paracoccus sp. SCSIO 75233]